MLERRSLAALIRRSRSNTYRILIRVGRHSNYAQLLCTDVATPHNTWYSAVHSVVPWGLSVLLLRIQQTDETVSHLNGALGRLGCV
jgi:hypothetical protein